MNRLKKILNPEPRWMAVRRRSNLLRREFWDEVAASPNVQVIEGGAQSATILRGRDHLDIEVFSHLGEDPARWSFDRFVLSSDDARHHLAGVWVQAGDAGHYRINDVPLGGELCEKLYPVLEAFLRQVDARQRADGEIIEPGYGE